MIKAIFFDMDGTLISFKTHEIDEKTFTTLRKLKEKGIRLFIATGRHTDGLGVLQQFPFDGYVTLNGQYVFLQDKTVIYENTIAKEELETICNYVSLHPFPCCFVKKDIQVFNYRDERVEEVNNITKNNAHPAGDISNIKNENVYQVMAFLNAEEEKQLLTQLPKCTSSRWYPTFCDISPIGGTKVKGIDSLLAYFHITKEETMAFGDGGNDLQMLQHVGIAIAMGNAEEKLKQIADYVTTDVDHDGITQACKHYQLID